MNTLKDLFRAIRKRLNDKTKELRTNIGERSNQ